MARVALVGMDRPGLIDALGARGLVAGNGVGRADAVRIAHCGPESAVLPWLLPSLHRTLMLVLTDAHDGAVVAALDAGADDAVPRTASDTLIAARAFALLRRGGDSRFLRIGELTIDMLERSATRAGRPIPLLPREYQLLLELAMAGGAPVSRMALLERVCGLRIDPGTNVLEVHISRLRAKLDRGYTTPMLITDKGRGYRLAGAAKAPSPA